MTNLCAIRRVESADLPMLLTWRNHPEVRRFMFSPNEILLEEHRNWFDKASADLKRNLLIVEESKKPLGFVQFSKIPDDHLANWGFFTRPEAPRGSGRKICEAALNFAFLELKLHKVCGQVIEGNSASIRIHSRLGFQKEGLLREQRFLDGSYHSVLHFGLLEQEWHDKLTNKENSSAKN